MIYLSIGCMQDCECGQDKTFSVPIVFPGYVDIMHLVFAY